MRMATRAALPPWPPQPAPGGGGERTPGAQQQQLKAEPGQEQNRTDWELQPRGHAGVTAHPGLKSLAHIHEAHRHAYS